MQVKLTRTHHGGLSIVFLIAPENISWGHGYCWYNVLLYFLWNNKLHYNNDISVGKKHKYIKHNELRMLQIDIFCSVNIIREPSISAQSSLKQSMRFHLNEGIDTQGDA